MNRDEFQGKFRQFRGRIKTEWGKLTDDELDQVQGNYDLLVGKIQEKYGTSREAIEHKLNTFFTEEPVSRV
jgi:uncharacterized protein YjbJ (UPF0337 family)